MYGIFCIANPLAQLGLINLQMVDNTNDTTTFHSQLSTGRLQIVEICHLSNYVNQPASYSQVQKLDTD